MRVPTTPAHIFFLRKKTPASHRARGGTPTVSRTLGTNREGKERMKSKASRVQRARIGSALITVVMVAALTGRPTRCLVSPPPLFFQNTQSHEKSPTSHRARGVPPTVCLALGENREGNESVKGKATRIQSSRIGSALVCVRRSAQHRELKLPQSTRCVLNTVLMVAVSTCGSIGASPPPLSSQNIRSQALGPEVKHQQ